MKRPQARFHYLAQILAQMGIGFVPPPADLPHRNSGVPGVIKIWRTLTGYRHRSYKTEADQVALDAAQARRETRAAKRHQDYLRCLANNPCLRRAP